MKKTALVTGSTRGIGKRIALDLLAEGNFVILNYANNDDDAVCLQQKLEEISPDFAIIKADLSCTEGLNKLITGVRAVTTKLDFIVFNAGLTIRRGFHDVTVTDWTNIFNCNITVPFFFLQGIEQMIRNDGRIIFVGSVLGRVPHSVSIPYGVSKAALETLAKYLVPIFSTRNVTVNVINPGFTETEWHTEKDDAHLQRIREKICLKRFAKVDEISSTCLHLINNGYITGQTITVDGGYSL